MGGGRKSRGDPPTPILTCSNRHTHSLSTVGSSHGKILHQSPKEVLIWSHGLTSQSGPAKPIQTVVSQVKGSVGTGGKKCKRGVEKMHVYSVQCLKCCSPKHYLFF
ncbi:hypothetical protein XENOCAPTIV_014034 [Xenoophorus captivus]|uniref:Uncharacterized protein n=1 Tax=Xenoophorus captivus TaxID=1517983 RepID=A0ABV0R3P9_9TELE